MSLFISNSTQQSWYIIAGILKHYILNTSTPLIFKDVLKDYSKFRNEACKALFLEEKASWEAEQKARMDKAQADGFQEGGRKYGDQNRYPHNASPANGYAKKPVKFYPPTLLQDVWEILFKEGIVEVFIHRLLGSQQDLVAYRHRSEKYVQLFEEIIGTNNQFNEMKTITTNFMYMIKDYLCRNVPELQSLGVGMSIYEVLKATRDAYTSRRYLDNSEAYLERDFFIQFETLSYAKALLNQMDEVAQKDELPTKCNYFLVCAEYIHTLFIYVYMVEFIKKYPFKKGDTHKEWTSELRQGSKYNVFSYLKEADYSSTYQVEKKRRDKKKDK